MDAKFSTGMAVLLTLSTLLLLTGLIHNTFFMNPPEEPPETKKSLFFIIDIEYIPIFGDHEKWCLHYAIDGILWSAFFNSLDEVNNYIMYLNEVAEGNMR